jgi:hypothetical protein
LNTAAQILKMGLSTIDQNEEFTYEEDAADSGGTGGCSSLG